MSRCDGMEDPALFIGYCETHSHTELAKFHRDHVVRIWELAGYKVDLLLMLQSVHSVDSLPTFLSVRYPVMKPLVERARRLQVMRVVK